MLNFIPDAAGNDHDQPAGRCERLEAIDLGIPPGAVSIEGVGIKPYVADSWVEHPRILPQQKHLIKDIIIYLRVKKGHVVLGGREMAHGAVAVMKVRAFLATLAVAAVSVPGALAQNQPKPCTVELATSEIFGHVVEIEGRSATAMMPLLNELQTINEKAKDPKKPIGAQLSVHDSRRFTEIADQIKSVRLSNFVESAHSRDAIFVEHMFQTAWTLYSSPGAVPPNTDVPGAFLVTMRFLFPSVEPDSAMTPRSSCTVESALTVAEVDAETRAINDPAIARDFPAMQQLQAKYGVAPGGAFDHSKVTPDDLRVLNRIALSMQVAVQEQHLAQDIKNILDWWRMANLVYETRKEDISTYGPDIKALGNTIESQQGSFDDRTKIMLGLWGKVNEKVPSDDMKMLNAMSPAIDAADKMVPPAE